jgi:cyanate permease
MPVLWGRMADATGSFQMGLTCLAVATAAALVLTLEIGAHVRRSLATA